MNIKKTLSMVFALIIVLTAAFPALTHAAGIPYTGSAFESNALVVLPVVDVDIPTSAGAIVVNPYALRVDEDDSQIISDVQTLTNRTPLPLQVSVSVTGTVNGEAKFSDTKVTKRETEKKIFLYLIFQEQTDPDDIRQVSYNPDNVKHILLSKSTVKKTDFITLKKAPLPDANYLSFQVFGNCAGSPTKEWTGNDTVGMTIAFSFKMVPGWKT